MSSEPEPSAGSGPDNSGPDNSGPDNSGPDNSGPDNSGPDNGGPDNSGPDNSGPDNGGPDNGGPDNGGQLRNIQRWMFNVITHPDGVHAGINSDSARETIDVAADSIETVIEPSRALDSFQRLDVYANAYYSRLLECMRNSFPALVAAIGEDAFDAFSFGYLQTYPSTTYTLNNLALKFVDYLEETRPTPADTEEVGVDKTGVEADWSDFVIDLAKLEQIFDAVFDGPGIEETPTDSSWTQQLAADAWESTRLEAVPCLRLMDFRFPVNQYFTAWRKDQAPPPPAPENTYLAVSRRDYIVRRFQLERLEYELLLRLVDGLSSGDAINEVAAEVDDFPVW
jgi:hypothetical protein